MTEAPDIELTPVGRRLHLEWGHLTPMLADLCASQAGYRGPDGDPCRWYAGLLALRAEALEHADAAQRVGQREYEHAEREQGCS